MNDLLREIAEQEAENEASYGGILSSLDIGVFDGTSDITTVPTIVISHTFCASRARYLVFL